MMKHLISGHVLCQSSRCNMILVLRWDRTGLRIVLVCTLIGIFMLHWFCERSILTDIFTSYQSNCFDILVKIKNVDLIKCDRRVSRIYISKIILFFLHQTGVIVVVIVW